MNTSIQKNPAGRKVIKDAFLAAFPLTVPIFAGFWFLGLTYGIYMNVFGSHGIPEAIAIAVVVLLHLWKRQILLSIAGGTICYMLLVQLVF